MNINTTEPRFTIINGQRVDCSIDWYGLMNIQRELRTITKNNIFIPSNDQISQWLFKFPRLSNEIQVKRDIQFDLYRETFCNLNHY
jgi:hypothetical protein